MFIIVAIAPGAIPLIRIPFSATSNAIDFVNISMPPFDAAYGAANGLGVVSVCGRWGQ
jgi:hypothetical protein